MRELRREDGFTLPEVMTAMAIALIVSMAAFALIDFTIRRSGEVAGRVEATQKGRGAMDAMTRQLRSQVCLDSTTPPLMIAGPNEVTFYTDLSDGSAGLAPERHSLVYDPEQRTLTQLDFPGTRAGETVTYDSTPARQHLLVQNVVPETEGAPIFEYFAFDTQDPPRPLLALSTPAVPELSSDDRARTVRMEITFRALPPNAEGTNARGSVLLHDDVYVRAADPDDPRDVRAPAEDDEVPPVCT